MKRILILFFMISILAYPVCADGFTVKGISSTNIISNNESLSSANIIMDIVANGGGQSVIGEWQSLAGNNLSFPLKIEIGNSQETLTYTIENQGELLKYNYYYLTPTIDYFLGIPYSVPPVCPDAPYYCFKTSEKDKLFVVNRIAQGSYGLLGNPERSGSEELSISVNGTSYTKRIGTGETARGTVQFYDSFGEWLGNAQFIGSAISGVATPNQNNYVATKNGVTWNIAPLVDYRAYEKSLYDADTKLKVWGEQETLILSWGTEKAYEPRACKDAFCKEVLNLIVLHNALLEQLQAKNVKIDYGSPTSGQKTIIEKGNVIDTLNRKIGYDEFVITLKASKIGILIQTGKPQIIDISIPAFNDGDNNGKMAVSLTNINLYPGIFAVNAPGTKESRISLSPGQEGYVELFFIDPIEGEINGTVTAYDINSGEQDTKDYTATVLPSKAFIPNQTTVYNDVVFQNSPDGMNQTEIENCGNKVFQFVNGKYSCFEIDAVKTLPEKTMVVGQKENIVYPDGTWHPGWFEWIALIFIGLLIILYFVEKIINKKSMGFKRKNLIGAGTILVILALVVILLTYMYIPQIEKRIDDIRFMLRVLARSY